MGRDRIIKVKICGITEHEEAKAAATAGADMLGFVFAESRRRVTPEMAREMACDLPKEVGTVGVFVNETKEEVTRIARLAGLTYIQLHGEEDPDYCRSLPLPVIKAFSISCRNDLAAINDYECAYYLLDSPGTSFRGGSGKAFDWSLLKGSCIPEGRLMLAGGLSRGNVLEALREVSPDAVDVSSGVETNGRKDTLKVFDFIKTVKSNY